MKRLISSLMLIIFIFAFTTVSFTESTLPVNLALNKPVSTSGQTDWLKTNLPASNLTDGKDASMALVKQVGEKIWWIQIDLGGYKSINQIIIKPYLEFFPKDFTIDVWTGSKWVRVVRKFNQSSWTSSDQIYGFGDITCRYVRVTITEMNNKGLEYTVRLQELAVYINPDVTDAQKINAMDTVPDGKSEPAQITKSPTDIPTPTPIGKTPTPVSNTTIYNSKGNVAFKKKVATSGQTEWLIANLPASLLTDGTSKDMALVRQRSNELSWWMQIDLSGNYQINKIVVKPSTEFYPKDFTIDVWTGSQWKNVVRKYNQAAWTNEDQVFAFDKTSCRYIRLTATTLNNKDKEFTLRMCELEAYENAIVTATQRAYSIDSIPAGKSKPTLPSKVPTDTTVDFPLDVKAGDIALNTQVNASDRFEGGGFALVHLTDGYYTTTSVTDASTKASTAKWFQVDLEQKYDINTIELVASSDCFPKDFVIDVWTGTQWKRVVRQYNFKVPANEEVLSFGFDTVSCRIVRITATKTTTDTNGTYFMKLCELAVYFNKNINTKDKTGVIDDNPTGDSEYPLPQTLTLKNGTQGARKGYEVENTFYGSVVKSESGSASSVITTTSNSANVPETNSVDIFKLLMGAVIILAGITGLALSFIKLKNAGLHGTRSAGGGLV